MAELFNRVNRCTHRSFVRGAALLGILLLAQCGPDSPNPLAPFTTAATQHAALQKLTDSVAVQVAAIRGRSFVRPVTARLQTSQQYLSEVQSDRDWQQFAAISAELTHFFKRTGFIRTEDDLGDYAQTLLELNTKLPIAYYKIGSDTITIITPDQRARTIDSLMRSAELHITVAHELTHALQDQTLAAFSKQRHSATTSDYYSAHTALVEGEADFMERLYSARYPLFEEPLSAASQQLLVGEQLSNAEYLYNSVDRRIASGALPYPPFMWLPVYANYALGGGWIANTFQNRGWVGVEQQHAQSSFSMLEVMSFDSLQAEALSATPFVSYVDTSYFYLSDAFGAFDVSMVLGLNTAPGAVGPLMKDRVGYRGDWIVYWRSSASHPGSFIWIFSFEDVLRADRGLDRFGQLIQNTAGIAARPPLTLLSIDSTTQVDSRIARYSGNGQSAALVQLSRLLFWIDNAGSVQESIIADIINPALAKRSASTLPLRSFRPPRRTY